jgi:hypothetical protein
MSDTGNGHSLASIEPPVAGPMSSIPALPPDQLDGIHEFGLMRNWVSFDAQRGKLLCRNLNGEYDEFVGTILESRVVRVMKDEDGNVFCSAVDRVTADTGRPGRQCETCEDRDAHCFRRWWIAWQDVDTGLVFAHTLSQTGSLNFNRYANVLLSEGLLPSQAMTRIFVEEARRQKANTVYRRVQFERLDKVS